MQLTVDNAKGELTPGGYATVKADLATSAGAFRLPVSALIFDAGGLRIATLDAKNQVAFKSVTIARDLGSEIEIGAGLFADDRVIATPPDGLAEANAVQIADKAARAPDQVSAQSSSAAP